MWERRARAGATDRSACDGGRIYQHGYSSSQYQVFDPVEPNIVTRSTNTIHNVVFVIPRYCNLKYQHGYSSSQYQFFDPVEPNIVTWSTNTIHNVVFVMGKFNDISGLTKFNKINSEKREEEG